MFKYSMYGLSDNSSQRGASADYKLKLTTANVVLLNISTEFMSNILYGDFLK
jgi:hypothetical protein